MSSKLHLFAAYGIELEYMIVAKDTLAALPISDLVLARMNKGVPCSDVEHGEVAWSNELVKHVIELKANGPHVNLVELYQCFVKEIGDVQEILEGFGAKLLPTAMHPTFKPETETKLWDFDNAEIYAAYNRIFDCRGHGWSNLQSIHINLPFCGDSEFAKLHAAIRVVLPFLPVLAASSPLCEGGYGPYLDTRLYYYSQNQRRIPSILGQMIPEAVYSEADYQEHIFKPIFRDIAPFDPDGELQDEWLNSRAAIARFSRGAIEIRLLDITECVRSDMAIVSLVVSAVRALTEERWSPLSDVMKIDTALLKSLLMEILEKGEDALVSHPSVLRCFGLRESVTGRDLWRHVLAASEPEDTSVQFFSPTLHTILEKGPLARRIKNAVGDQPTGDKIRNVYARLGECLVTDTLFY